MEYRKFGKSMGMLAAFWLAWGGMTNAHAYPYYNAGLGQGFWGPVAGPRECDATNADGICIAWHSTLKGVSLARLAQCTAWSCDLRPETRAFRSAPERDDSLQQQLAVQPHEIVPLILDGNGKPVKGTSAPARAQRSATAPGAYDPIQPLVIEVHSK